MPGARDASARSTTVVFNIKAEPGQYPPQFVALTDGTVMGYWPARDDTYWTQRIDPSGRMLGRPVSSGLAASFGNRPAPVVALPDGDVAMFGLGERGVLMTIGSHEPKRRLAPTLVAVGDGQVSLLAAAVVRDAIVLAIMRARQQVPLDFSSPEWEPWRALELHWIGRTGKALRPSVDWKTYSDSTRASQLEMSFCDGSYHLAWNTSDSVLTTVVDGTLKPAPEVALPMTLSVERLGKLICNGDGAWLSVSATDVNGQGVPRLYVAELPAREGSSWRVHALPRSPLTNEYGTLSIFAVRGASRGGSRASLLIYGDGGDRFVTLELDDPSEAAIPGILTQEESCLLLPDADTAICGKVNKDDFDDVDYDNAPSHLEVAVYGARAAGVEASVASGELWPRGAKPAATQPAWQRIERKPDSCKLAR